MATWYPAPDLDEDEDEAEARSTRRNTRQMDTDTRPLALRKCPRCGHYFAEMFFHYTYRSICRLCEHEAEYPLKPTRLLGKQS